MWFNIATKIPGMSAKQCEERYKTVLKRKKRIPSEKQMLDSEPKHLVKLLSDNRTNSNKPSNDSEGKKPTKINNSECEKSNTKLDSKEIESSKTEAEIEIHRTETKTSKSLITENSTVNNSSTLAEVMWQITTKKEEAKERRHQEKMKAVKETQEILLKILEATQRRFS